MKKLYILISTLLLSFIIFIYLIMTPKDYALKYNFNGYEVTEKYVKTLDIYKIFINYENQTYPILVDKKYSSKRKLIEEIALIEEGNQKCIIITIAEKKYPVCTLNNMLIDYHLLDINLNKNEEPTEPILIYSNTKIYNLNKKKFLIWNYQGFDYLSEKYNETINILNNDEYDNLLSYQFNQYMIIPNYDKKYNFDEFYVFNVDKLELSNFEVDEDISYFSIFLGDVNNDLYLLDKKNQRQYKINIRKQKFDIIGSNSKGAIFYDGFSWKETNINDLINDNITFKKPIKYEYIIKNDQLYLKIDDYLILLTHKKVKDVIAVKNDEVYFLVDDILYVHNLQLGIVKLIENNEWNFNYLNKIYIFN